MWMTNKEDTFASMPGIEETECSQGNMPADKRQIKIGLLVWALIWIANISVVSLTFLLLPNSSYVTADLLLKAVNCIVTIVLIVYTTRNWHWNLDDWGFTYDLRIWGILVVVFVFIGYFWYREGLPIDFGVQAVRQALTGMWEELM